MHSVGESYRGKNCMSPPLKTVSWRGVEAHVTVASFRSQYPFPDVCLHTEDSRPRKTYW
jgi:hypothetical protein